ncbi:MAG: EamA family transporter, partial [Blastocatellia bacterium]
FLGGNGAVVWSEQRVPSGLTALMIGTEPLWMALLDWWRPGGRRPDLQIALGLVAGFGATVLLVVPGKSSGGVDPIGAIVLVFGTLCWAVGSLYSRHADSPRSQLLTAGMQLLAGGLLLLVLALLSGEARGFSPSAISLKSLFCFSYLVIFGAVVAFTCYNYMLKSTSTAMSSTYAFVNPAVAVVLGALIGGERITRWTMVAASAIVLAVVLITTHKAPAQVRNKAVSEEAEPEPAQSTTPTEYEVP